MRLERLGSNGPRRSSVRPWSDRENIPCIALSAWGMPAYSLLRSARGGWATRDDVRTMQHSVRVIYTLILSGDRTLRKTSGRLAGSDSVLSNALMWLTIPVPLRLRARPISLPFLKIGQSALRVAFLKLARGGEVGVPLQLERRRRAHEARPSASIQRAQLDASRPRRPHAQQCRSGNPNARPAAHS